ncbi:MAG: MoxR family ATPase [Candidatus Thermoplasmatota archaeon]|nr:MoxR family ATPase [Euryarchaeota archaeon]MBU4031759.1 MoxR family ATPase [Candidatus Thermoplasmatota archaeon]MBU4072116.1 MoxR family ATPase [Candidatus Thermoplasmatota archaeon]MBU4144993.1 MoxR family ATPase [Candidatus Thermoplasmatota archaeon]MBU4592007.1 MoxR family ATPase [Candidatus Thermoplasmatota archaeon]
MGIRTEVAKAIVEKDSVIEQLMLAFLGGGHVLFEDYPGLAKTLMANSFSKAIGCGFKRVQFTPDLLPADITGTFILNRSTSQFELRKGPIFTNILLADEINRAPPKTQSALLEAMQEFQVTLEGDTHKLPGPFMVVATQNPIEYEGTYPLPEAQIDRFLMRLSIGYPSLKGEAEILRRRRARKTDEVAMTSVSSPAVILEMQRAIEDVHVDADIENYIVSIVHETRKHGQVEVGASPRGSLALMKLSQAKAAVAGRDYVLPDDVKDIAVPALAHRLILKPDPWIKGIKPKVIIDKVLSTVPVPKARA